MEGGKEGCRSWQARPAHAGRTTSTADKTRMFDEGCPGSIEGKTNDLQGTPR